MRHLTEEQTKALAFELLEKHGLSHWGFRFDNANRRLGRCWRRRMYISVSRKWLPLIDESDVRDTILHEIAHALTPMYVQSHGREWRAKAALVGARPVACASLNVAPKPNYTASCNKCGKVFRRYRLPGRGRRYHCPCTRNAMGIYLFDRPVLKWERTDRLPDEG